MVILAFVMDVLPMDFKLVGMYEHYTWDYHLFEYYYCNVILFLLDVAFSRNT